MSSSANAILLAITGWNPTEWDARFRALAPGRDIRLWPDRVGNKADIAYACGFNDLSYFNHRFRARFGAAPNDFRGGGR